MGAPLAVALKSREAAGAAAAQAQCAPQVWRSRAAHHYATHLQPALHTCAWIQRAKLMVFKNQESSRHTFTMHVGTVSPTLCCFGGGSRRYQGLYARRPSAHPELEGGTVVNALHGAHLSHGTGGGGDLPALGVGAGDILQVGGERAEGARSTGRRGAGTTSKMIM